MPSETQLYSLGGKIISLTAEQYSAHMLDLERRTRTGEFRYEKDHCQSQFEDIKRSWPEDVKAFARKRMAELAGKGSTPAITCQVIKEAIIQVVIPKRKRRGTSTEHERKISSADLALSAVLGVAPDVGDVPSHRKVGLMTIATRSMWHENDKMIIREGDDLADAFVFCLYDKWTGESWLIGWASRQDVLLAKKGNRITDPANCPWASLSYYLPLRELRPMIALVKQCGMTGVLSEGCMLEKVPEAKDLPFPCKMSSEEFMSSKEESAEEFYKILGINPPITSSHPETSPTAQEW